MNPSTEPPKVSILRLIITIASTAAIVILLASILAKAHGSVVNKTNYKEIIVISQSPDTIGYKKIEYCYYKGRKHYFLRLDSLTAKQIIEAISRYHNIPVEYRSVTLVKEDACFDGSIILDDKMKNIITILNRLGIYVKHDGKKMVAGD